MCQARSAGRGSEAAHKSNRRIWRRKEGEQHVAMGQQSTNSTTRSSEPLAQAGEQSPPQPIARLTDSNKTFETAADAPHTTTHNMARPVEEGFEGKPSTTTSDPRKLIATISDSLLAALRSTCNAKASVSLLGRIQGKHPGLKALTAWAWETLHPTLVLLSLKSNNIFEVTFETSEGGNPRAQPSRFSLRIGYDILLKLAPTL